MGFIVQRPGTYSLLVDQGRPGSRHLGVTMGGAADRSAWMIGNALVGNPSNALALEMTLQGPTLQATDSHSLVVFGANFSLKLMDQAGNLLQPVPHGHVFNIEQGQIVSIGTVTDKGLRAYLCVSGAWISNTILGSDSMLGPIQSGAKLDCAVGRSIKPRWILIEPWADEPQASVLRLLASTHLTQKIQSQLEKTIFSVRSESNRMGIRLDSEQAWPTEQAEMLSAPVVPGTVQLPGGGQPIILGVDAQTIGGYQRLGYVISADLDQLAQFRPGDSVRFEFVNEAEAERLRTSRQSWLRTWLDRLHWQQF